MEASILGANCRHNYFSYVEGVMEPSYTEEQLAHIDDGLGCTFEGRTYTAYGATQKQRQIEETIRSAKRKMAAYKDIDPEKYQAAKIRLRILNEKYREFSKAAGLPEQRERTKVLYLDALSKVKSAGNLEKR